MQILRSMPANRAMAVSALLLMQSALAPAVTIDQSDPNSIKAAAKEIASEMMG